MNAVDTFVFVHALPYEFDFLYTIGRPPLDFNRLVMWMNATMHLVRRSYPYLCFDSDEGSVSLISHRLTGLSLNVGYWYNH